MPDKRKILYDALTAKNIPLGSYDMYLAKIATPENRQKLFDVATKSGISVGDYNRFESELVGNQKIVSIQPGRVPTKAEQDVSRRIQLRVGAINSPFETIGKSISNSNVPRGDVPRMLGKAADFLASPATSTASGLYKLMNTAETTQEKINAGLETAGGIASAPFMFSSPVVRGIAAGSSIGSEIPGVKTGLEFFGSPAQTLTGEQGGTPETIDRLYQLGSMAVGYKKGLNSPQAREKYLETQRINTYEKGVKSVLPQLKQNTKSLNTPEVKEAIAHNNAVKAGKIKAPLKPIPIQEGTTEFNQIIKESIPLVQDVLQETGKINPTKTKSAHKQFAEILDIANKRVQEKYEFVADKYKDIGITFKGEPTTVGELNNSIKWINAQKSVKGLGKLKTEYELQSELASRPRLATMINDVNEARDVLFDTYQRLGVKGIPEARKLLSNNIKLQELINNRVASVENETNLTGSALHRVYPSKWGMAEAVISTPYRKTIGKFFSDDQKLARSVNALYKVKPKEYAKVTESGAIDRYKTMGLQMQAQNLGITFNGWQKVKGGEPIALFTDSKTGTTFGKGANETVAEALQRKRKQFGVE